MKNKATVYILGFMVAAVWGLIIYRVMEAAKGDDQPAFQPVQINRTKEPQNDYALVKDTTGLKLNYRDPFGQVKPVNEPEQIPVSQLASPTPVIVTRSVAPRPVINWNFIRYSGYIRNPHTKKLIAVVNINGRSLMMSEGESSQQVKLLKNMKDSIKVAYQNKTRFIAISSDAS